jgi:hypothetical protein
VKCIGLKKFVIEVFEIVNILCDITQFGILERKHEFAMWHDVAILLSTIKILSTP